MVKSDDGYVNSLNEWIGKYANCHFDYFARHQSGPAINYDFNSRGYRGPEHWANPDISVFGSSFSFGVGVAHHQCWHQLLGDYRVNCYSAAGILVTNNDIIEQSKHCDAPAKITILQLREFRYNVGDIVLPSDAKCFVVDEFEHPNILNLPWSSFVDKATDGLHPGPATHKLWAKIIKKMFDL